MAAPPPGRADNDIQWCGAVVAQADDYLPIDRLLIHPDWSLQHCSHVVGAGLRIADRDVPGGCLALAHGSVSDGLDDIERACRAKCDCPYCGAYQRGTEHGKVGATGEYRCDGEE